jgi:hypothetical protein
MQSDQPFSAQNLPIDIGILRRADFTCMQTFEDCNSTALKIPPR